MGGALVAAAAGRASGSPCSTPATCGAGFDAARLTGAQRRFSDGDAERWADRVDDCAGFSAKRLVRLGAAAHCVRAVDERRWPSWPAGPRPTGRAPPHAPVGAAGRERGGAGRHRPHAHRAARGRRRARAPHHRGPRHPPDRRRHQGAGRAGTGVCLCPTTEPDLGDGVGPAGRLAAAGCPLSLGTDSHAVVDLFEEARLVELHERLAQRRRGGHTPAALLRGRHRRRLPGARVVGRRRWAGGGAGGRAPRRPSWSTPSAIRRWRAGHPATASPGSCSGPRRRRSPTSSWRADADRVVTGRSSRDRRTVGGPDRPGGAGPGPPSDRPDRGPTSCGDLAAASRSVDRRTSRYGSRSPTPDRMGWSPRGRSAWPAGAGWVRPMTDLPPEHGRRLHGRRRWRPRHPGAGRLPHPPGVRRRPGGGVRGPAGRRQLRGARRGRAAASRPRSPPPGRRTRTSWCRAATRRAAHLLRDGGDHRRDQVGLRARPRDRAAACSRVARRSAASYACGCARRSSVRTRSRRSTGAARRPTSTWCATTWSRPWRRPASRMRSTPSASASPSRPSR